MANVVEIIITAGVSKALKGLKSVNSGLVKIAKSAAALGVAMGGMAILSVKAFASFESAFAGVRKTIDGTEQDFAILAKGIRNMAQEIPASVVEISKVAEAAGQLGIAKENVLDFTRTMIDLGNTTNLTAEVAATQLARLANVTNLPKDKFDELGSTIVGLGNNLATTEAEITAMALRLAGAGSQIGLTQDQILSFSAALSSVGIEAEAGGTAFSRVMVEMANASATGGKKLQQFADVAGMSVADFKKTFETDASGALVTFVEGLDKTAKSGGNVFATLEDMGFANVRVRDALLRASGAGDLFRRSLEIGSKAWEENTALTKEAATRYETLTSKWKVTLNVINDVAISIGEVLAPAIIKGLDAVQSFSKAFGKAFVVLVGMSDEALTLIKDIFNRSWLDIAASLFKISSVIWVPLGESFTVIGANIKFGWQILMNNLAQGMTDMALSIVNKMNTILPKAFQIDTSFLENLSKVIREELIDPPKTMATAYQDSIDLIKGMFVSLGEDPAIKEFADKFEENLNKMEDQAIEFSEVVAPAIQTALTGGGEDGQEAIKGFWEGFGTTVHDAMMTFTDIATSTWNTFETGFGNAIANVIVRGEDLGSALSNVFKNILAQFISMIIQMTVRWIAFQALTGGAFGGVGGFAGKALGFSGGGVPTGGLTPVSAATGGVFKKPTLAVIGDNPERQEAVIPMRNGKVGVELKGNNQGGGGVQIGSLNIMPNSSIDEAIMNKSPEWWEKAIKKGILPALDNLGSNGITTTMQSREGRV